MSAEHSEATIDYRRRTWQDAEMGDTPNCQTVWQSGQCVGLIVGDPSIKPGTVRYYLVLRPTDLGLLYDSQSLVEAQAWAKANL